MAREIERKYLPQTPDWRPTGTPVRLVQGYFWPGETANAQLEQKQGNWALQLTLLPSGTIHAIPLPPADAAELYEATVGKLMDAGWTLRIRTEGSSQQGIFCIKSKAKGISRAEYEYVLDAGMTAQLLQACHTTHIVKDRYKLDYEGYIWEVDVYQNPLPDEPAVTIEVELPDETTTPPQPVWVGAEISHIKTYTNAAMARRRSQATKQD